MPPTTSWFRLHDVLPLAAHAVTCPEHQLTAAQYRHGSRLTPALIWHGDAHELTSNGIPGWYDEDTQPHAAPAWTWQHPTSGRSGHPHDTTDLFLPLMRRTGGRTPLGDLLHLRRLPLITLLRRGARRGKHWCALDTDPTTGHGRVRVRVLDHRDDIAAADATWRPAMVTAAAMAHGTYPALVAEGHTVHGDDVLARFDGPTVRQMITNLGAVHADTDRRTDPMPGEFAVLRLDGDAVVVAFDHDDGTETRLVETDRVYPDRDGYYPVGAYLWPWRRVY